MTDVLRIRRRVAGGAAGRPSSLNASELAYNEVDDTLWYGKGNSAGAATAIMPVGGQGAFLPIAGGTEQGHVAFQSGIDFGSVTTPSGLANDTSLHISLFGGNQYGFSITGGTLNILSNANVDLYSSTALAFRVGGTAVTSYMPLDFPGGTSTGGINGVTAATADSSTLLATTAFVKNQNYQTISGASGLYLPLSGGNMNTGASITITGPTGTGYYLGNYSDAFAQGNADGASILGANLQISSWNGIGFCNQINAPGNDFVPLGGHGVVIDTRHGSMDITGWIAARDCRVNYGHTFAQVSVMKTSATDMTIQTNNLCNAPTLASIAAGGTGNAVNDQFFDANGNYYLATAVTAGAVTALTMISSRLYYGFPAANPYPLTASQGFHGTGVSVNLNWSYPQRLVVQHTQGTLALYGSNSLTLTGGSSGTSVSGTFTTSGVYYAEGGINFNNAVAGGPQDLSRHIALWGGGSSGYGFSVSSNTLNYNSVGSQSHHDFYNDTTLLASIGNGVVTLNLPTTINSHLSATSNLYTGGLLTVAGGLGSIPAIFGGLQVGWNFISGNGEINFLNGGTGVEPGFSFRRVVSTGTSFQMAYLWAAGNLTLGHDPINAMDATTMQWVTARTPITVDAPNNIYSYGRRGGAWNFVPSWIGIGGGALDLNSLPQGTTSIYTITNQTSAPNWPSDNYDQTAALLHTYNSNGAWMSQLMMGGRQYGPQVALWYRSWDDGFGGWAPWNRLMGSLGGTFTGTVHSNQPIILTQTNVAFTVTSTGANYFGMYANDDTHFAIGLTNSDGFATQNLFRVSNIGDILPGGTIRLGAVNSNMGDVTGGIEFYPGYGGIGVTGGTINYNWTATHQFAQGNTPIMYISGGLTMQTPLWLWHDPVDVNEAATRRYVDTKVAGVSGGTVFVGTMNGSTGVCTFTTASGLPNGQLPAPSTAVNKYVIVNVAGTPASGYMSGVALAVQDWVMSDGSNWTHLAFNTGAILASTVQVSPTVAGQSNVQAALTTINTNQANYLLLAGGTMGGALFLNADPISASPASQAATKNYVDTKVAAGVVSWNGLTGVVNMTLAHVTGVGGAPLASPSFTGNPLGPTPATADSSTNLATTAFVKAQGYVTSGGAASAAPVQSVASKTGAVTLVHTDITDWTATLAPYALLSGPVFTNNPQGPTPSAADNSPSLATTQFVKAQGYATTAQLGSYLPIAGGTLQGGLHGPWYHATGATASYGAQGAYIMWNRAGAGVTNFVNNRGLGSGGFTFHDSDGTTDVELLSMTDGLATIYTALTINGALNGAAATFSGAVTVPSPSIGTQAATKDYVDSRPIPVVATYAVLRAATTSTLAAPSVWVQSYSGTRLVGGGWFFYVPSDTTTADNGGTILVDASSRRWYREYAQDGAVNVMWFGAVGDGSTNDAPAINAAIAALPAAGGVVELPVRQFAIASTINLGNGSTAGISTRQAIVLRGVGGIMSPFLLDGTTGVGAQLVWTGATNGTMVLINGPVQGCGVQNLYFQGNNTAGIGLQLTSASFGDFTNLSFLACREVSLYLFCSASGSTSNTMNNRFHNIFIRMEDIANVQGILLDSGTSAVDPCLNDFENMFINMPATAVGYGIYLKLCDSNTFRNILIQSPPSGSSASSVAVVFDYTSPESGANLFPCANAFYAIDTRGSGTAPTIGWANVGTPLDIAGPNFIHGLYQGNGAVVPQLANLGVDSPVLFYREWLNQSGVFGPTNGYLVYTDGLYSIDYCLVSYGGATSASTITPLFGAILTGSFIQNFSGAAVYVDNSHVGYTSSGRFTAHCAGASWISVQTLFTGSGTPTYDLYMNVQRLR